MIPLKLQKKTRQRIQLKSLPQYLQKQPTKENPNYEQETQQFYPTNSRHQLISIFIVFL